MPRWVGLGGWGCHMEFLLNEMHIGWIVLGRRLGKMFTTPPRGRFPAGQVPPSTLPKLPYHRLKPCRVSLLSNACPYGLPLMVHLAPFSLWSCALAIGTVVSQDLGRAHLPCPFAGLYPGCESHDSVTIALLDGTQKPWALHPALLVWF